jgi:hypothetical protein
VEIHFDHHKCKQAKNVRLVKIEHPNNVRRALLAAAPVSGPLYRTALRAFSGNVDLKMFGSLGTNAQHDETHSGNEDGE